MFCTGNMDDINSKIIELPFQNKHLSMLILLPKDVEDESTGLEKVRRLAGTQHGGTPAMAERRVHYGDVRSGWQPYLTHPGSVISKGFRDLSGAFPL
jgi:hypothetical protein